MKNDAARRSVCWRRPRSRSVSASTRSGAAARSAPRVIVVGLDGADWQLLDAYVAKGAMPELARLAREGRSGELRSLVPALSPLVWTTIATGVSPLQHRILDFTRFNPATGAARADHVRRAARQGGLGDGGPVGPRRRRLRAVGDAPGRAGAGAHGLGPASSPSSARRRRRRRTSCTRRRRALGARRARGAPTPRWRCPRCRRTCPGSPRPSTATSRPGRTPSRTPSPRCGASWWRRGCTTGWPRSYARRARPALTFVYIQGTDSIGHVFSPYAPPRLPSIDPADFERYSRVPETYFREVDGLLGDYRKLAEEQDATLLVVSDHGFLWSEGRPPRPDSLAKASAGLWHRQQGIYVLWGRGIAPVQERVERRRRAGRRHRAGAAGAAARGRHRGPRAARRRGERSHARLRPPRRDVGGAGRGGTGEPRGAREAQGARLPRRGRVGVAPRRARRTRRGRRARTTTRG